MKIAEALALLDPSNDAHWTSDGSPRVEAVSELIGRSVKRGDIRAVDDQFTRELAKSRQEGMPTAAEQESQESRETINKAEPSIRRQEEAEAKMRRKAEDAETARIAAINELVGKIADFTPTFEAAKAELDEAKSKFAVTNERMDALSRELEKLEALDRKKLDRSIRNYIEAAKATRAERAGRAAAFMGKISPDELRDMVQPGSRLDQAMRARKPGRGQSRPDFSKKS